MQIKLKYNSNAIQIDYKYATSMQRRGKGGKNLSNMFALHRLAQYEIFNI